MKNKIAYRIGVVILALSFLHPFSGTIVRASHPDVHAAADDDRKQEEERPAPDRDTETAPEEAKPDKSTGTEPEEAKPDKSTETASEEAKPDKTTEAEAEEAKPDKTTEAEPEGPASDRDTEADAEEAKPDKDAEAGPETEGSAETESVRPHSDEAAEQKTDRPAEEGSIEATADQEEHADTDSVIVSFYGMKKDNEYFLLEKRKADNTGRTAFPAAPKAPGFRFAGWETADFRRVKETDSFAESVSLYAVFVPQEGTAFAAMTRAGSLGISASGPQAGQENRYEYGGGRVNWSVPATGYYDLYCYGAQGGTGYAENGTSSAAAAAGGKGDAVGSRVLLKKGTVLTICAGQMPGLSTIHLGEGDSGGQSWSGGPYASVDGYETFLKEWSHAGDRTNGECFRYRGYPDGSYGGKEAAFCDNTGDHSGGAAGGGGGGSSSITCNGAKIISAAGGNGGTASYKTHDFAGTANGGSGGGFTGLRNAAGLVWQTDRLHVQTAGANSGNGYVRIRVADISPIVTITASTAEWTREDVILTAEIESPGQGLPDTCISWEQDGNGDAVWTDNLTRAVSQNGTYTCRVRDTAGNIGEASLTVENMDRLKPSGEIRLSTAEWTTEDVTLEIFGEDAAETDSFGMSGLEDNAFLWGRQYASGEIIWEQEEKGGVPGDSATDFAGQALWTARTEYPVKENGTYLCRIRDRAGNIGEISCRVTGIDRTAPSVIYRREQAWYEGSCEVRLEGTDLQPDGTPGCGLADKPYSADGVTYTDDPGLTITKEGPVTVWVKDRLGNARKVTFSFFYDRREPESGEKADNDGETGGDGGGDRVLPAPQPSDLQPLIPTPAAHAERISLPYPSALFRPGSGQEPAPAETKVQEPSIPAPTEDPAAPRRDAVKLPVNEKQKEEIYRPAVMDEETPPVREWTWKKLAKYSAWLAAALCGLLWLLFCLLFEHVTVYRRDENGTYREIGRCAIHRKKDYKQINLLRLMKPEENRDHKVAFSRLFVLLHRKEKVLLRTFHGVELRNIEKEIEILSCNFENDVLR